MTENQIRDFERPRPRRRVERDIGPRRAEGEEGSEVRPIAHSVISAARLTSTSKSQLYNEIAAGRLRAHKRGRNTLILDADLRAWAESLPLK